jgi:hypothetical protein
VRVYATAQDVSDYRDGKPNPTNIDGRLARASALVEAAARTAIYDVDQDGMPTAADVVEAFQLAVCAQVDWQLSTGDSNGAGSRYQSVSIGSVALTKGATAATGTSPRDRLAPDAEIYLQAAGLLPGVIVDPAVITY